MKTVGNPQTQELLSLHETCPRGFEDDPGYHVEQLCPPGKFWQSHPDAPWNQEGADPDPAKHTDENGDSILWEAPQVLPLVKNPRIEETSGKVAVPRLDWFDDRVERNWILRDETPEEAADRKRKIWANASEFFNEFTLEEQSAIAIHPNLAGLTIQLAMWPGEVHSDDPRISGGLQACVSYGLFTDERIQQVLTP